MTDAVVSYVSDRISVFDQTETAQNGQFNFFMEPEHWGSLSLLVEILGSRHASDDQRQN